MDSVDTSRTFALTDDAATRSLGGCLGRAAEAGAVLLLEGDLGAGKTTLTQGLASGLGIEDPVSSPTFALMQEYEGRLPLRHLDLYRLDPGEVAALGPEEWFEDSAVVVIEWPASLGRYRPADVLLARLDHAGEGRTIRLEATGAQGRRWLEAVAAVMGAA